VRPSEEVVDEDAPTTVFVRRTRAAPAPVPTRSDRDGLWNVNDVACFLNVSRSWVYHRAEAGLLPCVRIGSLLRFDPEVIKHVGRGGSTAAVQTSQRRSR
jgi:hypothetical protein